MNSNAIIFVYNGDAPQAETIRRMAEAIMNTLSIDHQSLTSYTLNEKEIAESIVSSVLSKKQDEDEKTCPEKNAVIYLNGIYGISLRDDAEATIDKITTHYILARFRGDDSEFVSAINIIATAATSMKLPTVKLVREHIRLGLKESKVLVDSIQDVYERCQGHIVG